MELVVNRTTREDDNNNQISNIIYNQNTMSISKDKNHNKIKLESDKTKTTQINLYLKREKVQGSKTRLHLRQQLISKWSISI